MNKITIIISLLFYILFTQVYPVVHWHAHEHQDGIELHLIAHPPEFSADGVNHDKNHEHSDANGHHESHFDGDWNYTLQSKPVRVQFRTQQFFFCEVLNIKSHTILVFTHEVPFLLPRYILPESLSNRAPPSFC